ncbi:YhdP family protein [Halorhodospira abdelmalekii]|uniref:YhdP family phospholipid transporter n=1 Tax=Halorhodospira abdelmalekii TaxID=421629 RepID=UPI001902DB86|nr:AsmA-like C-terminal region-containing protein [Halorhodospira abdelmalekii]
MLALIRSLLRLFAGALLTLGALVLLLLAAVRLLAWGEVALERPLTEVAEQLLERPVEIGQAQLRWQGVWPTLALQRVRLGDPDDVHEMLQLAALELAPRPGALFTAARGGYPVSIKLQQLRVAVHVEDDRSVRIGGLPQREAPAATLRLPDAIELTDAEIWLLQPEQAPSPLRGLRGRIVQRGAEAQAGLVVAGEEAVLGRGLELRANWPLDDPLQARLFARFAALDLAPIGEVAARLDEQLRAPTPAQRFAGLRGELSGQLRVELSAGLPQAVWGELALSDGGVHIGDYLLLSGVQGEAVFEGRRLFGELWMAEQPLGLPRLYREPLEIGAAQAEFSGGVLPQGGGWIELERSRVANRDLQGGGRGRFTLTPGQDPQLRIHAAFEPVAVTTAKPYLPEVLLPEPVYDWLQMALLGGQVERAELLFQGYPLDYPFSGVERGVFDARVAVRDGTLRYQEEWPSVTGLDAELRFYGTRLELLGHRGESCGAQLYGVELQIAELREALLELTGHAEGSAAAALCYLSESPIARQWLAEPPLALSAEGPLALDLGVRLPLSSALDEEPSYFGEVKADGVRVTAGRHSGRHGGDQAAGHGHTDDHTEDYVEISQLKGRLQFDRVGLHEIDLSGQWGGEPVTLSGGVQTRAGQLRTVVEAAAFGSPVSLIGPLERGWEWLDGAAAWRIELDAPVFTTLPSEFSELSEPSGVSEVVTAAVVGVVPPLAEALTARSARVRIDSDLAGVSLDFPAPFGLSREAPRELRAEVWIGEEGLSLYTGRLGDLVTLHARPAETAWPEAVGLHFGSGRPRLPELGITVSGRVDEADLDAWWTWWGRYGDSILGADLPVGGAHDPTGSTEKRGSTELHPSTTTALWPWRGQLTIAEARLFGRHYGVQHMRAEVDRERAWLALDGDLIAGQARWPQRDAILEIILEHLDIPYPLPEATDTSPVLEEEEFAQLRRLPQMANWPIVRGQIGSFRLQERHAGDVEFELHPQAGALVLERARLRGRTLEVDMSGRWEAEQTRILGRLRTPDVGRLLSLFQAPVAVDLARATVHGDVTWPGAPFDFAAPMLNGALELRMRDGRIREVEPGAGRLAGLLGLNMLPRRVLLDFGDLLAEGVLFDRVDGQVVFRDGRANFERFRIEAPLAPIWISGSVDLQARLYDTQIQVEPRVGGTLPIVGFLFGGGVGGAAGLLADWMVGQDVDRAMALRYHVTGPWEAPQVQRLRAGETPRPEAEEREAAPAPRPSRGPQAGPRRRPRQPRRVDHAGWTTQGGPRTESGTELNPGKTAWNRLYLIILRYNA